MQTKHTGPGRCDTAAMAARSALADTATYLSHHASAHARLVRSWPTDDVGTDIADHLRDTGQALILQPGHRTGFADLSTYDSLFGIGEVA